MEEQYERVRAVSGPKRAGSLAVPGSLKAHPPHEVWTARPFRVRRRRTTAKAHSRVGSTVQSR